ncbi:Uncharacterised protein [Mycobacteroides abscessus subsp. abscessus]|nr:Uncharacterised protein [Mycobacteroides abscessus subsp. abscessus]
MHGHRYPHALELHATYFQFLFQCPNFGSWSGNGARGCVGDTGNNEPTAQQRRDIGCRQQDARRGTTHSGEQPSARRNQRQDLINIDYAGQACRCVFAEAVPEHRVRCQPPGRKLSRQCVLGGHHGREDDIEPLLIEPPVPI